MKKILPLVVLLFFPAFAGAEITQDGYLITMDTGNDLLSACREDQEKYLSQKISISNTIACQSFLDGIVLMNNFTVTMNPNNNMVNFTQFCLPAEVTRRQIRMVVLKYLKENPEGLHLDAFSNAAKALQISFNCFHKIQDVE